MKTFRRYSAALAAAGEQDIIRISVAGEKLYIVPGEGYMDSIEEICVLVHEEPKGSQVRPSRNVAGNVTPRHLKRLGNANWALTAQEIKSRLAEPNGQERYFGERPRG